VLDATSSVCVVCGQPFNLTAGEREWYQKRMTEDPLFKLPRRCKACLEKRKEDKPSKNPPDSHPAPPERGVPRAELHKPGKDEIRVVLATVDFEDLVSGRAVFWRPEKIRIVLADIGFEAMRQAIDRAEIEKKLSAVS